MWASSPNGVCTISHRARQWGSRRASVGGTRSARATIWRIRRRISCSQARAHPFARSVVAVALARALCRPSRGPDLHIRHVAGQRDRCRAESRSCTSVCGSRSVCRCLPEDIPGSTRRRRSSRTSSAGWTAGSRGSRNGIDGAAAGHDLLGVERISAGRKLDDALFQLAAAEGRDADFLADLGGRAQRQSARQLACRRKGAAATRFRPG